MGQPPQVKHQKPFIINILALAIPLRVVITMITATQKNTGIMNWIVEQVPFWCEALSASIPPPYQ